MPQIPTTCRGNSYWNYGAMDREPPIFKSCEIVQVPFVELNFEKVPSSLRKAANACLLLLACSRCNGFADGCCYEVTCTNGRNKLATSE